MEFVFQCFIAFVVFLMGLLLFQTVDEINLDYELKKATPVVRIFTPEHKETRLVGKVAVTRTIPDQWDLKVSLGGGVVVQCPSEERYHNQGVSKYVEALVAKGRLTNKYYCEKVLTYQN